MAHVAVDGGRVRPVGLDGHDGEAVALDQAPGDGGAGAIELRRAVRGLAEQHDARRRKPVEGGSERRVIDGWQRLDGSPRSADTIGTGCCRRDWLCRGAAGADAGAAGAR